MVKGEHNGAHAGRLKEPDVVGRVRTCSQISGHVTMYVPTVGLQFLVNAIVNQAIVESAALEVITVVLIDDCLTA